MLKGRVKESGLKLSAVDMVNAMVFEIKQIALSTAVHFSDNKIKLSSRIPLLSDYYFTVDTNKLSNPQQKKKAKEC
jgi:hypothetical protein